MKNKICNFRPRVVEKECLYEIDERYHEFTYIDLLVGILRLFILVPPTPDLST